MSVSGRQLTLIYLLLQVKIAEFCIILDWRVQHGYGGLEKQSTFSVASKATHDMYSMISVACKVISQSQKFSTYGI